MTRGLLRAATTALLVEVDDLDAVARASTPRSRTAARRGWSTSSRPRAPLLLVTDPGRTSAEVAPVVRSTAALTDARARDGELVEIPVTYDGEDLDAVAELPGLRPGRARGAGTRPADGRSRSAASHPASATSSGSAGRCDVPRRGVARTRSRPAPSRWPASSPASTRATSPGGWQLLGRTDAADVLDLDRDPPALLRPGARVRFVVEGVADARDGTCSDGPLHHGPGPGRPGSARSASGGRGRSTAVRTGSPTGWSATPDAAVLEVTFGGCPLRADATVVAVTTGARCRSTGGRDRGPRTCGAGASRSARPADRRPAHLRRGPRGLRRRRRCSAAAHRPARRPRAAAAAAGDVLPSGRAGGACPVVDLAAVRPRRPAESSSGGARTARRLVPRGRAPCARPGGQRRQRPRRPPAGRAAARAHRSASCRARAWSAARSRCPPRVPRCSSSPTTR